MLHGVMDPQPGSFGFALFDGDRELVKTSCPMHGRDAAALPEFVEAQLAQINLKLSDVKRWTVGSGPGSFTFLRVVAALAAGWKFGNADITFRCVPGAVAVAAASGIKSGETAGVLYDGRNKEILYFEVVNRDGSFESTGVTAVLNAEQAKEFFAQNHPEKLCGFECEADAIRKILPEDLTLTVCVPELAALASNRAIEFNDDLNDLVYIRPAVF
ncbi:MAG: hypothetical protein IJY46_06455 [Lentisphaeria bacterium]|nr:hypothetical protein [Lentisphaeria bacterium]